MEGFLLWTASSSSKAQRRRRQAPPTTPSWWSSGQSSMCAFCLPLKYDVRKREVRLSDRFFFPPPPPIKGVVVKTDYVPLLQSLAPYGWRLMCVLPTPIVKTNRYRFYQGQNLTPRLFFFLLVPIISNNVASIQRGLITPPVSFLLGILGLNAVA